jgi:DNA modification methylase
MTQQPTLTLLHGDNRDVMRTLAAKSVQVCATSGPYYKKRLYDDPPVVYGGDAACPHEWVDNGIKVLHTDDPTKKSTIATPLTNGQNRVTSAHRGDTCAICGAWRGELGWEPTPQMFVAHLVEVFAEVWRVLRDDGLLFVNLMDTRVGGGRGGGTAKQQTNKGSLVGPMGDVGMRAKDMALVPERFVLAMQDAGWYVRSKIIWAKGESFNPYRAGSTMPESARDRPTDSYETIFMFSKAPRYYSDMAAVAEAANYDGRKDTKLKPSDKYAGRNIHASQPNTMHNDGVERWRTDETGKPVRNLRSVWTVPPAKLDGDVWRINTKGTAIPHYATYPLELAATMIRMSTSEHGACGECGAPWERVVERTAGISKPTPKSQSAHEMRGGHGTPVGTVGQSGGSRIDGTSRTVGWCPTCDHTDAPTVPCTVLDCFGGSGTTGRAAYALGRNSVCIELKQEYHDLAEEHRPIPDAQPALL